MICAAGAKKLRFLANSEEKNLLLYPTDNFGQSHSIDDFQCPQPFQRIVLRNRYITPCCSLDKRLIMGKIGEDTIYDVWNGDRMRYLRQLHIDKQYEKNHSKLVKFYERILKLAWYDFSNLPICYFPEES